LPTPTPSPPFRLEIRRPFDLSQTGTGSPRLPRPAVPARILEPRIDRPFQLTGPPIGAQIDSQLSHRPPPDLRRCPDRPSQLSLSNPAQTGRPVPALSLEPSTEHRPRAPRHLFPVRRLLLSQFSSNNFSKNLKQIQRFREKERANQLTFEINPLL